MARERGHIPDREHLCFLAILLGFVTWYLWTAAAASFTFSNLILIGPVGAVAVVLLLYVGATEFLGRAPSQVPAVSEQTEPPPAAGGRFRSASLGTVAALMGLFGLFVVAIPYIGFDVATFIFVAATMGLLGERRVVYLLGLALGIAAALSIAALTLLSFPMPLTVARALWSAW